MSRMALGPTQPPIQWVSWALSLGVKQPGHEADHSPPCSAEVKNVWHYTSTPQYIFMVWYLVKHRDNFTFTLLYPSTSRSPKWSLSLSFLTKIVFIFLIFPKNATRPTHLILLDLITLGEGYILWLSSLCSFFSLFVIHLL
jgi:hypothetical protein